MKKKIVICLTFILILVRIFLLYIVRKKQLYLEYDYMYNVINYLILMVAFFIYFNGKKIRYAYWGVLIILMIINTFGIYKSIENVQFQSKFTHLENSFIVRETKDEPEFSLVYAKSHKIFIRLIDKIKIKDGYKPFSNNKYEINWIKDDKALVKYSYGSDLKIRGHILNFSKVNGPYSNVLASLEGKWADKNDSLNTLTFDRGQITYKNGNEIYWYSSSMSDEQGNYGSILYGADNTPILYILKNDDNTITLGYIEFRDNKQIIYSK